MLIIFCIKNNFWREFFIKIPQLFLAWMFHNKISPSDILWLWNFSNMILNEMLSCLPTMMSKSHTKIIPFISLTTRKYEKNDEDFDVPCYQKEIWNASLRAKKNFFLSITLFFFIINSTYSQFYRIKTPLFIVVCILFGKLSKYEGKEETTKDRHELFITKKKRNTVRWRKKRLSFLITNTIQYPKVPSCACFLLTNKKKSSFYTIENLCLARVESSRMREKDKGIYHHRPSEQFELSKSNFQIIQISKKKIQ